MAPFYSPFWHPNKKGFQIHPGCSAPWESHWGWALCHKNWPKGFWIDFSWRAWEVWEIPSGNPWFCQAISGGGGFFGQAKMAGTPWVFWVVSFPCFKVIFQNSSQGQYIKKPEPQIFGFEVYEQQLRGMCSVVDISRCLVWSSAFVLFGSWNIEISRSRVQKDNMFTISFAPQSLDFMNSSIQRCFSFKNESFSGSSSSGFFDGFAASRFRDFPFAHFEATQGATQWRQKDQKDCGCCGGHWLANDSDEWLDTVQSLKVTFLLVSSYRGRCSLHIS